MRLLLFGALGHMGQEVVKVANERENISLLQVDKNGGHTLHEAESIDVDVILDFSHHTATPALLDFAKRKRVPLVIATTGHTETELSAISDAAEDIPVLLCENLSFGILLFFDMVQQLARYFGDGDGEIIEIHRKGKLDRPSGTAKRLKNHIQQVTGKEDLPIHAIRLGDTVGIHTFVYGNEEESICITHQVHHRRLFAKGGIAACEFLLGKPAGLYRLEDMVNRQ